MNEDIPPVHKDKNEQGPPPIEQGFGAPPNLDHAATDMQDLQSTAASDKEHVEEVRQNLEAIPNRDSQDDVQKEIKITKENTVKKPTLLKRLQAIIAKRREIAEIKKWAKNLPADSPEMAKLSENFRKGRIESIKHDNVFLVKEIVKLTTGERSFRVEQLVSGREEFFSERDLGYFGPFITVEEGDGLIFTERPAEEVKEGDITIAGNFDVDVIPKAELKEIQEMEKEE